MGDSDAIERVEAGDAVPFVNDSELGKLTRFERQLVHSGVEMYDCVPMSRN